MHQSGSTESAARTGAETKADSSIGPREGLGGKSQRPSCTGWLADQKRGTHPGRTPLRLPVRWFRATIRPRRSATARLRLSRKDLSPLREQETQGRPQTGGGGQLQNRRRRG